MKAKYSPFSRMLGIILAVCLLVTSFTLLPATANEESEGPAGTVEDLLSTYNGSDLLVGASVQDITPTSDMLPIAWGNYGYLVGVLENLNVRVIALNDGTETSLIISFETGKGPYPPVFLKELAEHTGVDEANIFWSTTHSHAAPEITTDIDLDSDDNISKWGKLVMEQMKVCADEAMQNMEPAEIGIGYSNSYINVNRNTAYTSADGTVTRAEGYNGEGNSDKTLTVIQFNSLASGDPIAFIVHHATHGVVMFANQYFDSAYEGINYEADEKFAGDTNGMMGIHPDFPGLVSNYLEEYYDGCVALWMSGAAGDQNPIVRNELFTADPTTGTKESTYISGGSVEICEYLAKIQFADVLTAISTIDEFNSEVSVTTVSGSTDVPGQEGYSDVPMYLTVMRIGDIALVGSPGELFNSIGVYMKENSLLEHTLVVNHCWTSVSGSGGYYTDDFGLINGGPNTNARYAVGYINEYMTTLMNDLIEETYWADNGDGTATSTETGETVIVGLDGEAGTEDDNRVVNPAGKVLLEDVIVSYDNDGTVYIDLGNGFKLYGGEDGSIGTGDDIISEFGSYAQSDSTGATKDPLNWRLLDIVDEEAVLIAEHSVDAVLFNLSDNSSSNAWINSNLRSWLNSRGGTAYNVGANDDTAGFYDTAFNNAEKQLIKLSDIKMDYSDQEQWDTSLDDYNGTTGTYPAYDRVLYATGTTSPWVLTTTTGESTQDYVYAISGEEYFEYFGAGYLEGDGWELANYRDGYFTATEYAKARGAKNSSTQGLTDLADSWARSPGREGLDANGNAYGVFWSGTGSMNVGREVNNSQGSKTYGIIPMIRVNLGEYDEYPEGVTVVEDETSPTGYMAHFVYKDADAESVYLQGDAMYFADENFLNTGTLYTPYEWEKGMYPISGVPAIAATETTPAIPATPKYNVSMTKISGSDLWTVSVPLPSGAYKYCYYVDGDGSPGTGTKVLDPANMPLMNPNTGNSANFSIVYMPFDSEKQDDDRSYMLPRDCENGSLEFETISGYINGQDRDVEIVVYLPYGYDVNRAEPYKVFYISHGGGGHERDWVNDGTMPNIMDNMIAEGRVEPTIVVALSYNTLGGSDATLATLMAQLQEEYVIPLMEIKYNASTEVNDRAFAGLSQGGLMTSYMMVNATANQGPKYGTYGIWSAKSVPTAELDAYKDDAGFLEELGKLNIVIDSGRQDKKHYDNSVTLIDKLEELGIDVYEPEYPDGGHDWMLWPKLLVNFAEVLWENDNDIDTALLEMAIEYAEELKADGALDNVVDVVKEEFEAALQNAYDVLNSTSSTQDDADAAFMRLMSVIAKADWVKGDKTQLQRLVTLTKATVELNGGLDKYVDTSEYENALAAAETVLANGNALQDDVDEAYEALWNAFKALRLKVDKTALSAMIAEAQTYDLTLYTTDSVEVLNAALASAMAVYEDESLSEDDQETVNAAVTVLSEAIDNLILIATGGDSSADDSSTDDSSTGGSTTGSSSNGSSSTGSSSTGSTTTKTTSTASTTATKTSVAKTGDVAPYVVIVFIIVAAFITISSRRKARK